MQREASPPCSLVQPASQDTHAMISVQNENDRPLDVATCKDVVTGDIRASGGITTGTDEKAASALLNVTGKAFIVYLTRRPEGVFVRCIAHRAAWSCTFEVYDQELQGTGAISAPERAAPVQLETKRPDTSKRAEPLSPGRKKRQRQ